MPRMVCNGLQLEYEDTGTGVPLLFLNGLAGDHLYWRGQVRAFAGQFRCVALDNRDAGQSAQATGPYAIADLAEDVAELVRGLNLPPAHVVGLSLGGMVAQELALSHPDMVRSLFLVGTLGRADDWFRSTLDTFSLIRRQVASTPAFFEALLAWLVSYRYFEATTKVEWLRAMFQRTPSPQPAEAFFRQLAAMQRHDTLDRLPAIKCPVLVAVGEDDLIAPPRYSRQIVERMPQARLEILPGIGHAPPLEDSRLFNRVLAGFLA